MSTSAHNMNDLAQKEMLLQSLLVVLYEKNFLIPKVYTTTDMQWDSKNAYGINLIYM